MKIEWTVLTGPGTASELDPQLAAQKYQSRAGRIRTMRLPLGFGDLVERYAKPIAVAIDLATADLSPLLGFGRKYATKFAAGCSACSKRRKLLNLIVRNVRSVREWWACWRRIGPAWREVYGCVKGGLRRP